MRPAQRTLVLHTGDPVIVNNRESNESLDSTLTALRKASRTLAKNSEGRGCCARAVSSKGQLPLTVSSLAVIPQRLFYRIT
jgi:hypothetical protein